MKKPLEKFARSKPARAPIVAPVAQEHRVQKKLVNIAGLAAVKAVFDQDPDRVERLYYEDRMKPKVGAFCAVMAKARRPYRIVTAEEMERVAGTAVHGGVVAAAAPQNTLIMTTDKLKAWAKEKAPMLMLDGVSNPHNLGAIVRTAAFFGIPRIGLSDHAAQAGLSDAAYRVAEGGFEYVEIFRIKDFTTSLKDLRAHYYVVAAAPGKHAKLSGLHAVNKPIALIMGNEEEGLAPATLKACDSVVAIHGSGNIQSLNVSASAAILIQALMDGAA